MKCDEAMVVKYYNILLVGSPNVEHVNIWLVKTLGFCYSNFRKLTGTSFLSSILPYKFKYFGSRPMYVLAI